ncbi:MAG: hypothetical protein KGJ68_08145 [Gammaproteobacteria bacterium]|nr:hypothetical protein [Gammaproteobacteria bacterium]
MPDEPDAFLLRRFAESRRPLADAQFVAQLTARLPAYSLRRALAAAGTGTLRGVFAGMSFGLLGPLKLRNAGVVALAALGVCVWSVLQGSL